ncbi:hypothetical protein ACJ41O_005051 [Fusarium nematophilum]
MSLLSLPQELILHITKQLPLPDVEVLAQTFNRHLYNLCIPSLTKRIAARKHAKRMCSRFGGAIFNANISRELGDEDAQLLGLGSRKDVSPPNSPPNLDYLGLNGDLSWLKPLDEHTANEMAVYRQGPAAKTSTLMDKIIADAERLGLELPGGFVEFMSSEALQYCIPSAQAAFFTLGEDGLRKCPASVDGGAGGYLIRILADQQWCYVWNLYLCQGGHAILGGFPNVNADPDEAAEDLLDDDATTQDEANQAKEEGNPLASVSQGDLGLHSTNFEEFLATTYYEERIWFVLHDDSVVTQDLRDYVINTYKRRGNKPAEALLDGAVTTDKTWSASPAPTK